MNFKFELGQYVELTESDEKGEIVGRAEYSNCVDNFLVRYKAGDGRQVEVWWPEDALEAEETEP